MIYIFSLCLGLIAYTYLIYPLSVYLFSWLFPSIPQTEVEHIPRVAMVVAAYNEGGNIEEKIANCLAIDYPQDKIRFIFGSDGSTDNTNQVLTSQQHPQISYTLFPEREGKSSVLNKLIADIDEEILLLSDANTILDPGSVKLLVSHFADVDVGGVCGRLTLVNKDGTPGGEGEGLYWRYENMIKMSEGRLQSVISANGAIFAVRTDLVDTLPVNRIVNDDFSITLAILKSYRRVVYEPEARAVEHTSPDMAGELKRKIRISTLNFNAFPEILPLLKPRYGLIALFIFSHKIIRWMVPVLGAGLLLSNLVLLRWGVFYQFALIGQGLVYLGALLGYLGDRLFNDAGPLIPFYYLAMINIAIVIGLFRSLSGSHQDVWERVPH